jgi:hypothetical protein
MARGESAHRNQSIQGGHSAPGAQREILAQFEAAISRMRPTEIQDVLRLLSASAAGADPAECAPLPSRRRPRRPDAVTYRVRVDLKGTKPPLWRRLELASDLFLSELHDIIQAAFGWTDSHLHRFGSGPDFYSHETEYYLCPFDVAEGEDGIPEEQVRLDEVLADDGGRLIYVYDFGDDWEHVIRLEGVLHREDSAPRAVCTDGRRPGPPEDCGGAGAYELTVAATDPAHPEHAEAAAEFARMYGDDLDPGALGTTPFDRDEINETLAGFGTGAATAAGAGPGSLPVPLAELLGSIKAPAAARQLQRLIRDAGLDKPAQVDTETAARMVRPYAWLLNRVGTDGIKLTDAGHLPPAHVKAAMTELGLDAEWIGAGNRENQTVPVLHLRESAQKMGLLRKYRGRLLLTSRGSAVREDPAALWPHLAERMPLKSSAIYEVHAGLILLICVAARFTGTLDETIGRLLTAIGWINSDGTPLTDIAASQAAWDTRTVLRRLGALPDHRPGAAGPAPEGVMFARAALVTWPDCD